MRLVAELLRVQVSVHLCDPHANTAVHLAASNGHSNVCKVLLAAGASGYTNNASGQPAWKLAVQGGHSECRRCFVPSVSDKDMLAAGAPSFAACPPLFAAAAVADVVAVEVALTADETAARAVAAQDVTPLHVACAARGGAAIVGLLLAANAPVDAACASGVTPLGVACECGHADAAARLLTAGASAVKPDVQGWSALMRASQNGHAEVVAVLLRDTPCREAVDWHSADRNYSALKLAARNGHVAVVKQLLDVGAPLHTQTRDGSTALIRACDGGHAGVCTALLEARAHLEFPKKRNGAGPLAVAAESGQVPCTSEPSPPRLAHPSPALPCLSC